MSINLKDPEATYTVLLRPYPEKIQYTTSRIHQQMKQCLPRPRNKKKSTLPEDIEQISKPDFLISKTAKENLRDTVLLQIKRNFGKPCFTFDKKEVDHLNHILKFWSSTYFLLINETINPFFIFFVQLKSRI